MKKYSPYSELKIFRHTQQIEGILAGKRVAPIYLRIKPTNVCNQRCSYCGYANNSVFEERTVKRDSISLDILDNTLRQFKDMGGKAVTYSGGGEPLCYHSIDHILKLTYDLGLDCSMITNGQALKGNVVEYLKHAKWIRVSFDASNTEVYHDIRQVNTFSQVVQNIEDFAKVKDGTCVLGVNCVISETNADQIYDICTLVKTIGCDNIKLSPVLVKEDEEGYHNRIKDGVIEQIDRAKKELEDENFRIVDKYSNDYALSDSYIKPYHRCYIQEYFAVVAADSKVYRCHQRAYTEAGLIGDLTKHTFKEIWESQETIDKIRNFDPCKECNFRCAFDERNTLLNDFFNMDTNHVNFV